jgi:predicted metal-binding membrane protein
MPAFRDFPHLPPAAARLGAALGHPKLIALACIVSLTALGWLYLALLIAGMGGPPAAMGPGMGLLDALPRALQAICRPLFGLDAGHASLAVVLPMWAAMTLAMMLPTAGPMILTYAEIAETAGQKGERIVSPLVLAGGYGAVWLGFAIAASLLQLAFARLALLDATMASASALFSGAIFIAAGAYQFTPMKHACLAHCQRPFPFFFANWQTTPRGVFRLGLRQGAYCLGCCWAMMLVMFAVGTMNVVWMAALGIAMTIEKIGTGRAFSHAIGSVLMVAGVGFVAAGFAAHWPGLTG